MNGFRAWVVNTDLITQLVIFQDKQIDWCVELYLHWKDIARVDKQSSVQYKVMFYMDHSLPGNVVHGP